MLDLVSFNSLVKDLYPHAGERIKQWVVDERKRAAWVAATCPRVAIADHNDNTGMWCHNSGGARWCDLAGHDCCSICDDVAEHERMRPDIVAWRAELDARPPMTADRTLLSDEIAPDVRLELHPMFRSKR